MSLFGSTAPSERSACEPAIHYVCLGSACATRPARPSETGWADNLGVVGAAAKLKLKGLSLKQPVAAELQAAAVCCMRECINVRVSHVAGSRNEWADMLSRGAAAYPDFWQRLSAKSRRSLDWQQLLRSGRPECLSQASKTGPWCKVL